ncbi:DUF554 domain-containing protein [Longivirga aurantiaca]|uniref:DUF554 domain-containing protein n=1 Tax=Longivirga aurantiaca TaxID=1837743 RepID=A0ABW1T0Y9_9ACTN
MPPGTGTLVNVVAILIGSGIGVALGDRLPERTRQVVTDGLGLVVLLVAGLSAVAVLDPALREATGTGAPVLIVLGSLLVGSVVGSLLGLEQRLEAVGAWLRRRLVRGDDAPGSHRFVEGFVTASLVFCVGPLAILGSLSDGLGTGIEQLALKATLDGFASIAFAAALGWGVAASALAVIAYQGFWTLVGLALGDLLPAAQIAAITATGGLLLVGVALRLLRIRDVPVADMLPALVVAPLLTAAVAAFM